MAKHVPEFEMSRFLTGAVKLIAAAGVIIAEGFWSSYLTTCTWMKQPVLAITILANAAAAVALSLIILWLDRHNVVRIATTLALVMVGILLIAPFGDPMMRGSYDHLGGVETIEGTSVCTAIGALVGYVVSQMIQRKPMGDLRAARGTSSKLNMSR